MNNATTRRYFHTFDALRFFAFFKVFLLHLPITAFPVFNYIKAGGGIGVQFFFVLSGFLITYIILAEQQLHGQFSLKNFFMRRILRIWPLYYLIILIAFLTPYILQLLHMPYYSAGYKPELWKSLLFLENYKMMQTNSFPNVAPLGVIWSLCIEEHYYLVWGLLLYFLKQRGLPVLIIVSIIIGLVCRIIYTQQGIATLDLLTNIDLFAFGAIPAYLLITNKEKTLKLASSIPLNFKRLFALLLIIVVAICSQYTKDEYAFIWMTTLLGLLFTILIWLTLPSETDFSIKDNNILSRLGIYTYGLYMYHTLVIIIIMQIFNLYKVNINQPIWATAFVLLSLATTILCSIMSYHLFEKQLLKLKKKFR